MTIEEMTTLWHNHYNIVRNLISIHCKWDLSLKLHFKTHTINLSHCMIYKDIYFGVFKNANGDLYINNSFGNLKIYEKYNIYWPDNLDRSKLNKYDRTGTISILLYINDNIERFEEELLSEVINTI